MARLRSPTSARSQLSLELPRRGGARRGAGRKPKGDRAGVSHRPRPKLSRHTPAHVSLRVLPHVWNLRSGRALRVIEAALDGALHAGDAFRVVHFSVEATTSTSSSRRTGTTPSPPACRGSRSGSPRG